MPLDPDFVAQCPYGGESLLLDEVVEVNAAENRVVARMTPHAELPLVRDQRVHATRHPAHVAGGLLVHASGILGFVHAYYVIGLRMRDGWTGYGAKIHEASFRSLARIDEAILLECRAKLVRRRSASVIARYEFTFTQDGVVVYEGDQTAMFTKVD